MTDTQILKQIKLYFKDIVNNNKQKENINKHIYFLTLKFGNSSRMSDYRQAAKLEDRLKKLI